MNPDGGSFVSATLAQLLPKPGDDERDGEGRRAPVFDVRVFHPRGGTVAPLTDLDRVRVGQRPYLHHPDDALHPALSVTTAPLAQLPARLVAGAHVAVVTDLTTPAVVTVPDRSDTTASGGSLYGLVARFVGTFIAAGDSVRWEYRVPPLARAELHPLRNGVTEVLLGAQRAHLFAMGRLLAPGATEPATARADRGL